jgi:hypothetical protein
MEVIDFFGRDEALAHLCSACSETSKLDFGRLVEVLSTNLLSVTRCDFCALLLPDADSGELRVTTLYNPDARGSLCDGTIIPIHGSICGKAFWTGKTQHFNHFEEVRDDPESFGNNVGRHFYQRVMAEGLVSGCEHDSEKTNDGTIGSLFGRRVCSDHHNHGAGTQAAVPAVLRSAFGPLADGVELCSKLSIHRHCLGQSSPSAAICGACNATPDLDKLRTLVYGVTGTILDGVGRRYAVGSGSRLRICGGFCSGGIGVPSVRAPCPGSSRS